MGSEEQSIYYDAKSGELVVGVKTETGYAVKVEKSENHSEIAIEEASIGKILKNPQVVVIDSSKSGTGRDDRDFYSGVIKVVFEKLDIDHTYFHTTNASSIEEFGSSLDPNQDYTIILISGDTSINELINSLSEGTGHSINIFNIPFGTGNSLALSLGLVNEFKALQKLLTHSNEPPKQFNVYNVDFPEGSYFLLGDEKQKKVKPHLKFIVVLSWGFHASLVADSDTPELRKFGLERFKMAAMKNLQSPQFYDGTTYLPQKTIQGPYAYWLVTPSKKFEPTFEISPKGNIFDKNLYLVSFNSEESPSYIMDIMQEVYNQGSHVTNEKVVYEEIESSQRITLKINSAKEKGKRRFCVDGAIVLLPESEEHEILIHSEGNKVSNWNLFLVI